MLFNYRYVQHPIETFQTYLDHLVKQVWCTPADTFHVNLLHPGLRDIVMDIYNTDEDEPKGKIKDWLFGPIKEIFEIFLNQLTQLQRQQIATWYDHNNNIEALCSGAAGSSPVTYDEIGTINAALADKLKAFCTSLFTNVIGLKAVTSRLGEIDQHYDAFAAQNKEGVCPYCGYGPIKGVYHSKRDAYDHFLPKGTYPFNSVNFQNLAPMCHDCNSSYKLEKDPIRTGGGARRKAFYSYSTLPSGIVISMVLASKNVAELQPNEIDLKLSADGREEEVLGWKDIFGIEERYKAKLCTESDGRAWLMRIVDEGPCSRGWNREDALTYELSCADRLPFSDANFLKKPFLVACKAAGIL